MTDTKTSAQTDQDALRRQIHTIALAVCTLKGLPTPNDEAITAIAFEAARVLGEKSAHEPREVARVLVKQTLSFLV